MKKSEAGAALFEKAQQTSRSIEQPFYKILSGIIPKRIVIFPWKPDRMPGSKSRIDMATVVAEAATDPLESIKHGILEACHWVIERLHDHADYQALIEGMKNAMNSRMAGFLQGRGNGFIALE